MDLGQWPPPVSTTGTYYGHPPPLRQRFPPLLGGEVFPCSVRRPAFFPLCTLAVLLRIMLDFSEMIIHEYRHCTHDLRGWQQDVGADANRIARRIAHCKNSGEMTAGDGPRTLARSLQYHLSPLPYHTSPSILLAPIEYAYRTSVWTFQISRLRVIGWLHNRILRHQKQLLRDSSIPPPC